MLDMKSSGQTMLGLGGEFRVRYEIFRTDDAGVGREIKS